MATLHIGQLHTLSVSLPFWAGHRARMLNTAGFPGTKMKCGNGVVLAEAKRVASRELSMELLFRTKASG